MKASLSAIMVAVCLITALPMSVAAAPEYPYGDYDFNNDGVISQEDIDELTTLVISGKMNVCSLITAYRQMLMAYETVETPKTAETTETIETVETLETIRTIEVLELPNCESNDWLIRNWLCSDYPRTVSFDDNEVSVVFTTLEGYVVLHWSDVCTNENNTDEIICNYWEGFTVYSDYSVYVLP